MPCCRFTILCVVAILCISLCVGIGSSHVKMCTGIERQALLKLKDGFIHGREILTSWNGEDCCEWEGVSCNNLTGYVTSLDLEGYINGTLLPLPLGGKLDSSICEVQHLTSINLDYNNLQGKIPKCIGSLSQLVELNLANNELVSPIPPSLGNLTNLQTLDLGGNHFVANELDWLSHLSNLRYLDLSSTNLGQAENWLSSITKIPSLSDLYLDGCGLYQVIPKSIPHINSSTSLKALFLSSNELNSSSISWVLNVSKVLTRLYLQYNSLSTIPDGFSSMTSLQYLYLSFNEFEGSIPKSIQNMCQLKELDMSSNKLTGQLSENMLQLNCAQQNLESLDLSDNPFSNGLFPNFSWISTLKSLTLRNTNIVGPLLPHSISHFPYLASLKELDLSHNQLNDTIPYNIGQLSKLTSLSLSSNKLTGVIRESHLSNLSSLQHLDVAENSLSFNLSSKWIPPFQLDALLASSCNLGPKFPTWLKYQMKLRALDVSNCRIRDLIPNWFWELFSSLEYLNVSHNIFSGVLPKSLSSMKPPFPITLDFSFNKLSGTLPSFPEVEAVFLSNNMFSGSLSSFCATSNYLTYIDLSSNLLEGTLLDCWEKFQNLRVLNLANNSLSGTIPKSFGFLRQIESIHLSNNNFFGEIPSLALCSSLAFIDFGDNNLQGTLSNWMVHHHLHQLVVLRLHSNQLQGNIPTSLCDMPFLQVLDLSKNNISGKIPQCLNNITALSNMSFPRKDIGYLTFGTISGHEFKYGSFANKAIFAWKGANREYGKNLQYLTSIDLSNNHLTGEIPKSIAKLMALASLNVSGNHLTGFIPNNIGQMKTLESLDLSRNNLSGRMPASFSNLSLLSYMNLSFNNLYGKIPVGTQLQSFDPSRYMGNNGLCGPPLTNHCPGDVISPPTSPGKHATNEDDEDELITFGFYVSLVLGFFVGFWGVCGTLVIKTSWRHAYFQFFNNVNDWVHVTLAVSKARLKRRFHVQD